MAHITTCTACRVAYEEISEEVANAPTRECPSCWRRTHHEETNMDGWQKQKPTAPGAYYVRGFDFSKRRRLAVALNELLDLYPQEP